MWLTVTSSARHGNAVTSSTLLADPPIKRNHRSILHQKEIEESVTKQMVKLLAQDERLSYPVSCLLQRDCWSECGCFQRRLSIWDPPHPEILPHSDLQLYVQCGQLSSRPLEHKMASLTPDCLSDEKLSSWGVQTYRLVVGIFGNFCVVSRLFF